MASRVKRIKPAPHHPDGWNAPTASSEPSAASVAPPLADPPFEDVLYRILREAFVRSDAAARAVARLDYQLAIQQIAAASDDDTENKSEAKLEDKTKPASPDSSVALIRGSSQEFDDREFVDTFERLSFLRMAIDLVEVLKLHQVQPELLQALIDERFRPKVSQNRAAPETSTVAGSDMSVLLHNLKRAAERRSRTEPRSARAVK